MVLNQTESTQLKEIDYPQAPMVSLPDMLVFSSKQLHLALNQLAKKYGNIFQMRVGSRNFLVLNGVETLKEALVKQQDTFNAKADFNVFQLKPQVDFLELKNGECWKKHHDIVMQVMQTFWNGKSELHESWVTEEAEKLTDVLLGYSGQPLEIDSHISIATLSFMQRLAFDKKGSTEDADLVETAIALRTIPNGLLTGIILDVIPGFWQPIFGFLNQNTLKKFVGSLGTMDNYLAKNIEQHRESFDPENMRTITDGLFKIHSELSESDRNNFQLSDVIPGTLFQMMAAGTQLPAYVISWAVLYMIAYPEIQAKIHAELDQMIGEGQKISFKDRSKLPFTEACIHEIFRHSSSTTFPPINYATTTDANLQGYFVPKNTPLIVNYYGLTRDERYWQEPETFKPDRFLDQNGKIQNNLLDKFYPFGVGSRRCIGEYLGRMEIFLFLTNLLRKCKFEPVAGDTFSFEADLPGPFISPKEYRVVVKPRH